MQEKFRSKTFVFRSLKRKLFGDWILERMSSKLWYKLRIPRNSGYLMRLDFCSSIAHWLYFKTSSLHIIYNRYPCVVRSHMVEDLVFILFYSRWQCLVNAGFSLVCACLDLRRVFLFFATVSIGYIRWHYTFGFGWSLDLWCCVGSSSRLVLLR